MDERRGDELSSYHSDAPLRTPLSCYLLPSSTSSSSSVLSMESLVNEKSPPPTIQFPVSHLISSAERRRQDDEEWKGLDEMDFFADHTKDNNVVISDSKEGLHRQEPDLDFSINTRLGLHTANNANDHSMVEDRLPPADCEENNMSELEVVKADLERISSENQALKKMLHQVTDNYSNLHKQMITLMQQQKNDNGKLLIQQDNNNNNNSNNDSSGNGERRKLRPRQFVDLCLATGTSNEADETYNNHLPRAVERACRSSASGEDSPEKGSSSSGWGANKVVPTLEESGCDQAAATEATMRKARVCVRARSDSPMVPTGHFEPWTVATV
ncbi:unnamed protein product [Cuscuta epithymum]|uniref:Uncharacterized protein n=2 Tax=Cuscuta epithymum TaxID=186058 RepID=A0AAV0FJJ6_9ASTE|nr:unnamed protein product [Cuscuta epithymum]